MPIVSSSVSNTVVHKRSGSSPYPSVTSSSPHAQDSALK